MKILLHSRVFLPSYGGLEKMMHMLATEFACAGHLVTVVTATAAGVEPSAKYRVIRRPPLLKLVQEALASDICLEANVSLRTTPLFLLLGRKIVISHQLGYGDRSTWDPRHVAKRALTLMTHNIFCSQATSAAIPGRGVVIPNAYAHGTFKPPVHEVRDRDLVFLGRLVSDKGCHVLVHALGLLRDRGSKPTLTIIGSGPEEAALRDLVSELELADRVTFAGKLEGEPLAGTLCRHRIMVVPSVWEEPFGIVALEGAASGCVVIGSNGGGLPDAIGPAGIIVQSGNPAAFADGIETLLKDDAQMARHRAAARAHLARHTQTVIGARYLAALESIAGGHSLTAQEQEAEAPTTMRHLRRRSPSTANQSGTQGDRDA